MRILIDDEELLWGTAWQIVTNTFFYTNHTVLPVCLHLRSFSHEIDVPLAYAGSSRKMAYPAFGTSAS